MINIIMLIICLIPIAVSYTHLTLKSIKAKRDKKLWNAKMRFGKTLTALQVAKEANFKKSIIITHRPVVSDGWFDDFDKIFYNTEYRCV